MECLSYCIAQSIDLTKLDNHIKTNFPQFLSTRSRDVLKLSPPSEHPTNFQVNLYVFKNGTVVTWGIKRHQIDPYFKLIKPYADKLVSFRVRDQFSYRMGIRTAIESHDYFDVDCLTIEMDSDELKLSLSYGFSQSIKLQYFESIMDAIIEKYTPIIQNLANSGKMPITRTKIRQISSEILGAKSEMNLISNFLYHPKYFWQHPTLEEYYIMLERYLHIQRRVNTLNHRLDTLNEIFDMFNGYLESQHSHNLEIVIIVLITLEIIFAALNVHI